MMDEISLGEIAKVFNGKTPSKNEQRSEGHPVLKIRDVTESGQFRGSFESFVEFSFANKHEKKQIHTGDVLILNAAHNADYVGSKQFKASPDVEGSIATGEWLIARSADPRLSPDYLWHWFQSPTTRFAIKRKVKGIHLYPRDVADMAIPLPSISEQRRIAAILDKASGIRRKRERALALADDLLKSIFFEMFGDPEKNPKRFGVRQFGSLLEFPLRNGISPASLGQVEAEVLTLSAITGSAFDPAQRKIGKFLVPISQKDEVSSADFYICRGNGSADLVGRGFFAPNSMSGVAFPDTMIAARPKTREILPGFLETIWNSPYIRSQIVNAARTTNGTYKINQTATENISFPVPPPEDQKRYENVASKIRSFKRHLTDSSYGEDLFASLSQRAFRGEL